MSILFIGSIIGGFWFLGKILDTNKHGIQNTIPSAPPNPNTHSSRYITGTIKDSFFNYGETVLHMSNVRISNIHVYNKDKKKVDGKFIIMCGDKIIFSEKMKYQWVDTQGLLLHNATIKIETKDKIPLEYTIYYIDMNVHKDELNMMGR